MSAATLPTNGAPTGRTGWLVLGSRASVESVAPQAEFSMPVTLDWNALFSSAAITASTISRLVFAGGGGRKCFWCPSCQPDSGRARPK